MGGVAMGAWKEAAQEGVTSYLKDARNSAGETLEAAGMGAVGSGVIEGGMAGAGLATKAFSRPVMSTAVEASALVGEVPGYVSDLSEADVNLFADRRIRACRINFWRVIVQSMSVQVPSSVHSRRDWISSATTRSFSSGFRGRRP